MEACCSRFTAAEGGARLAAVACMRNTLTVEYSSFIATRLVYEEAYKIRGVLSEGRQRSVHITKPHRVPYIAYELNILTDLSVSQSVKYEDVFDWSAELEVKEVLVCTSNVLKQILNDGILRMVDINVLVIESCHMISDDEDLQYIMNVYKRCDEDHRPRILGLTYPLFTSPQKKPETIDETNEVIDKKDDGQGAESNVEASVPRKPENPFGVYENRDDFAMYEKLEWKIEELESALCSQMDLAEDIDGGKRLSSTIAKPKELIIQYGQHKCPSDLPEDYIDLVQYMKDTVNDAMQFIEEHRYDPTEIYGEDMYEEFKTIPDPTVEPRQMFRLFLYILDELGPFGADKAAFSLLAKLEKLKIKVPYERHFLLLCLCTTTFVRIRCYADNIFSKYTSEWDNIKLFCTPKVLRLAEILEKFQPKDSVNKVEDETKKSTSDMLDAIDKCDFKSLGDRIEDRVNVMQAGLKDLDIDAYDVSQDNVIELHKSSHKLNENSLHESEKSSHETEKSQHESEKSQHETEKSPPESNSISTVDSNTLRGVLGFPRRGNRTRGKGRIQRNNANRVQQMMQNPDALCGIVFMNDPLMAKIIFMIVADMSRCNIKLSYISAQYCCVERAPPADVPAECQRQGKKHEDVLKKFRMHECNLLLATSALEEGIDLPRCNLVLRWDLPPSYRSYGLCRGRARSARSASALLCPDSSVVQSVATYTTLDRIISKKCGCGIQDEPPQSEEDHADTFTSIVQPYTASTSDRQTDKQDADEEDTDDKIDDENETQCEDGNDDLNSVDDKHDSLNKMNDEVFKIVDNDNKTEYEDKVDDFKSANVDEDAKNCDVSDKLELSKEAELVKSTGKLGKEFEELIDTSKSSKEISESANSVVSNERKQSDNKLNDLDDKVSNIDGKTGVLKDLSDKNDEINSDICYKVDNKCGEFASVDLSTAVALINRYCGKLPSDTFTRLAPQWWMDRVQILLGDGKKEAFICTIRLPLNCPVKYNIVGHPMPTRVLAKRMVALQACRILHKSGELDNQLMPIGKENFQPDVEATSQGVTDSIDASDAARPGTNKRRQYYFKRTALAFTDCEPVIDTSDTELFPDENDRIPMENPMNIKKDNKRNMLYAIISQLWCALPERYNTRGRNLHAPENAPQAVAVLMARRGDSCLRIPAFPVYTRSGEVRVSVRHEPRADVRMSPTRAALVHRFMQFVFADVLRVRRRGMRLRTPHHNHNNYYIVPTVKVNCDDGTSYTNIDWNFLKLIYLHTEQQKLAEIEKPISEQETDDKENSEKKSKGNEMEDEDNVTQNSDDKTQNSKSKTQDSENQTPDRENKTQNSENKIQDSEDKTQNSENKTTNSEDKTKNSENETQNSKNKIRNVEDKPQDIEIKTHDSKNEPQNNDENHPKSKTEHEKPTDISKDKTINTKCKTTDVKRDNKQDRRDKVKKIDNPLLKKGEVFVFDADKYREAVVTPWYRNQDQPQFFLVAEICWNLSPDSEFPSTTHKSFRHYYQSKYGVELTQTKQPLLDVDHTSARLNLLTPRYVNRKGVALPVSSERTRRAKRDRLDQKQILLPELCRVHPFAAPLWFATVALPCVLYRINALLIADEIRRSVALDVGLGIPRIDDPNFEWPPLDFGWSLSEVLNADSEKNEKKKGDVNDTQNDTGNSQEDSETGVDKQNGRDDDKEKTINEILQEKIDAENQCFEIGTWTNEMASSIPQDEYDELLEPLPPNLTFCTSASGGTNWCDPVEKPKSKFNPTKNFSMADSDCSYMSSDFDTDDSDLNSLGSEDDTDTSGYCSKNSNAAMGVRIEYKTAHEAEAVDLEAKKKTKPSPELNVEDEAADSRQFCEFIVQGTPPDEYIDKFRKSVAEHKEEINKNCFIKHDEPILEILPENKDNKKLTISIENDTPTKVKELFPFMEINGDITLENIEKCKRKIISRLKDTLTVDEAKKLNCFSMKDVDIDAADYVNEKTTNIGFDGIEKYEKILSGCESEFRPYYMDGKVQSGKEFDFDYQPDLEGHPGPSPSVILQALTMSNANDGINLERLETIGDSFLKFAITAYLYCARPTVHEGKLSHMRSKQVSNLNLYRLGRNKRLGTLMIASKFEPHDNWLPPCHVPPPTLHPRMTDSKDDMEPECEPPVDNTGCFIPYNLITQHSIPDKSIADCVEALIGAYLLDCGARGALLFMSWLGIKVLPRHHVRLQRRDAASEKPPTQTDVPVSQDLSYESVKRPVGSLSSCLIDGEWVQPIFGELRAPPSPLLRYIADPEGELEQMLSGYDELERTLQYRFKDRSLLLQAMTHASHQKNRLTDCYQRLEFLGDAILDYLITRHLYEDPRRHSPGALTDLRSALVNNTIFATLAARHGFHKYFRHMSPGLNEVLTKYVKIQEENGHSISEEHYLIQEDEMEQAEDVEVPKALGDLFESVAGAIFLDSGMSLGAVWKSYVRLMGAELEAFSAAAPKSPVRELLEAEPDTAKFGKPSRLADGRRVRVCVEVFGRGVYRGVGRNYRIAKCTAARAALRHLRAGRR